MSTEHLDVLIVGAGISGIGAGCHLQKRCPDRTYAILEGRADIGGTWDLFRYPGIRSDSDMYTLGYSFKPWTGEKGIADGASILAYVRETAREHGVDEKVQFRTRVVAADWCDDAARWTVRLEDTRTGAARELVCRFLFMCAGYYRYDEGYTPQLPGIERFAGPVVHPQHWPEDLQYDGRRVVVVGSGATAVTLVPSLAERAAHVTMLQRTPTYIASMPSRDPLAQRLGGRLRPETVSAVVRWKNILRGIGLYQLSRRRPEALKSLVRKGLQRELPEGYDIGTHFTPPYDPWDQRFCLVPDSDLFRSLRKGTSSVVTGTIETFTETGVRLTSGDEIPADVVVTATGLQMLLLGGMRVSVDGEPVELSETVGYRGMMFSGVPNLAAAVGYTNASWTLRSDLVSAYVCRLLNRMRSEGFDAVTPRWSEPELPEVPFMDLQSGYVLRAVRHLPKQAARAPWRVHQNYLKDLLLMRYGRNQYEALELRRVPARVEQG
jgi:cation diffusion facilitator CzcD-associated flavoprotein CzcO